MPRTKVPRQIVLEGSGGSFETEESQKRKLKKSSSSVKSRRSSKDERRSSRDDVTSSPRGSSRHTRSTAEKREKERKIRKEKSHSKEDKEKRHKKKSRTRRKPVHDSSDSEEADFLLESLLDSDGEGLIQANAHNKTNNRHSAYDDDSSLEAMNRDRYEKVVHSSDEPGEEDDDDDDSMTPVKNRSVKDTNPFEDSSDEEGDFVPPTQKIEKSRKSSERSQKRQEKVPATNDFVEENSKNPFGGDDTASEEEGHENVGSNPFDDSSSIEAPAETTNPFEEEKTNPFDDSSVEAPEEMTNPPETNPFDDSSVDIPDEQSQDSDREEDVMITEATKPNTSENNTNPFENDADENEETPEQELNAGLEEVNGEATAELDWMREKITSKKGFGWAKKPKLPFLGKILQRAKDKKSADKEEQHLGTNSWDNPFVDLKVNTTQPEEVENSTEEDKRQLVKTSSTEEGVEASIDDGKTSPTDDTNWASGDDDEDEGDDEEEEEEEEEEEDIVESSKRLLQMANQRMEYQKDHDEIKHLREELDGMKEQASALTEQLRRSIETKCDLVLAQTELERFHEQCLLLKEEEIKDLRDFNLDLMEKSSNLEGRLMIEVGGLTEKINDMDRKHRNQILERDCEIAQLQQEIARMKTESVRSPASRTAFKSRFLNSREKPDEVENAPSVECA